MPSYHPVSLSAHISVAGLRDTTTRSIIAKRSDAANAQTETARKILKKGEVLEEERVPFPGDERGFELSFLGSVPFKQCLVGRELFYDDETLPKALALHVIFTEKSFICSFEDGKPQRLMVDVFFNGTLSSSVIADVKYNDNPNDYYQLFAGTRVENVAERPWVVLPPGLNADGSLRRAKKGSNAKERWEELCTALLKEVMERGVNESGERPPSAQYLHSLATMQIPDAVKHMQEPGGRKFGVIDVIVTAGEGKKVNNGMSYLKGPMRMENERFWKDEKEMGHAHAHGQESDEDAEGETDEDYEPEPPEAAVASLPSIPSLPTFSGVPRLPLMPNSRASAPISPLFPVADPKSSSFSSPVLSLTEDLQKISPQLAASSLNPALFSGPTPVLGPVFPTLEPTSLSGLPRQVSFGHTNVASYNPRALLSEAPIHLGLSGSGMPQMEEGPRDGEISPLAHRKPDVPPQIQFRGIPFEHRLNRPPLGPPPPVGFFSALPQPKSRSPVQQATVDPNLPALSWHLKHLVIVGKHRECIVDHTWRVPQRIAIKQQRSDWERSSSRIRSISPGSTEHNEVSEAARRGSNHCLTTPPSTSPGLVDPDMTMSVDKMKGDSIHDGHIIRMPGKPPTIGPALASIPEIRHVGYAEVIDLDEGVEDGEATVPNMPAVAYNTRRGNQALQLLGVQGPKASPFIFEDPEELLRRKAKLARAGVGVTSHPFDSEAAPKIVVPATSNSALRTSNPSDFDPFEEESSAPLSSVPSSRRPERIVSDMPTVNLSESGSSSDLSSAPDSPELALSEANIFTQIELALSEANIFTQIELASQSVIPVQPLPARVTGIPAQLSMSEPDQPSNMRRRTSSLSSALSFPGAPVKKTVVTAHGAQKSRREERIQPTLVANLPAPVPAQKSFAFTPRGSPNKRRRTSFASGAQNSSDLPLSALDQTASSSFPHTAAKKQTRLESFPSPRKLATQLDSTKSESTPPPKRSSRSTSVFTRSASISAPKRSASPPKSRSPPKKGSQSQPRLYPRPPPVFATTNSNPRLNQDCAIAFAVTGEDGARVLRQVKSERQGWFAEDEVVVGIRFFFPG